MKIKIGKLREDVTSHGNRFWIQIEDSEKCDNKDLQYLVDKEVTVIIGEIDAIDNLIQETLIL